MNELPSGGSFFYTEPLGAKKGRPRKIPFRVMFRRRELGKILSQARSTSYVLHKNVIAPEIRKDHFERW